MTEQFITLQYLSANYTYNPDTYIQDKWKSDDYARVLYMPVREMLSTGPVDLAEELVTLALGSEWTQQQKRPIRRGDSFTIGDTHWLFAATVDAPAFKDAGWESHPLKAFPSTLIVQLPRTV